MYAIDPTAAHQVVHVLEGLGPRAGGKRVTLGWIIANHGTVSVRLEDNGTHHMTQRADALRWARGILGPSWVIRWRGPREYYRREDGHDVSAHVYVMRDTRA